MTVRIEPAPMWIQDHHKRFGTFRFTPSPGWIFENSHHVWSTEEGRYIASPPPQQDVTLALELWRALDVISRRWYIEVGKSVGFDFVPLTADDLTALNSATSTLDYP